MDTSYSRNIYSYTLASSNIKNNGCFPTHVFANFILYELVLASILLRVFYITTLARVLCDMKSTSSYVVDSY